MILIDVNVLVYAHRTDAPNHPAMRKWLEDVINGDRAYGVSELVLSGFVRIVTHPAIFTPPSTVENALQFCTEIREQPHCVHVAPGPRHWEIFSKLCRTAG